MVYFRSSSPFIFGGTWDCIVSSALFLSSSPARKPEPIVERQPMTEVQEAPASSPGVPFLPHPALIPKTPNYCPFQEASPALRFPTAH